MKPSLTEQDFKDAADRLGCEVAAIKAVCKVEAPRGGFNPDDTPATLFEGHKFSGFTLGKFDASAPDISYPKWTTKFYGKTWEAEQDRLQRAIALNREAALKSASWGKFQIMGFNHELAGFKTLQEFINAMYRSERDQLMAFVSFIQKANLTGALRRLEWKSFARGYNGPSYAANQYDIKLAAAYASFKKLGG